LPSQRRKTAAASASDPIQTDHGNHSTQRRCQRHWNGAATQWHLAEQKLPIQVGAPRRVRRGQVIPGAALRQGTVPRVPGEHDRCGLSDTDHLHRGHRRQVRDLGHGWPGAVIIDG